MVVLYLRLGYNTHPPENPITLRNHIKYLHTKVLFNEDYRYRTNSFLNIRIASHKDEHYKKKGWGWPGSGWGGGGGGPRRNTKNLS